ncbi:MAG TPA: hypothetical protein VMN04_09425 [Thermoanaerobaculia bacterium]|nr:hypothetical protein [Thermoanaerobaculia bacterium]
MRHPLAALSAAILLAASLAARADDAPHGAAILSREAGDAPPSRIETAPRRPAAISGPIPIGVEADVYCSGFLGEADERHSGRIVAAEKEKNQTLFMTGDILYLDIGSADGVEAGMEFTVARPERLVNRWNSVRDVLGRIYLTPGRLRVICAQERSSIAEIDYACSDVEVGDVVIPFEQIPVPLVRRTLPLTTCDAPNGKPVGHIVETRDAVTPIGTGTVVFLDLGESDGLNPGDFLTVYRPSERAEGVRTVLGEAAILTTRSGTSVAIVTSMTDFMAVGDAVEVK